MVKKNSVLPHVQYIKFTHLAESIEYLEIPEIMNIQLKKLFFNGYLKALFGGQQAIKIWQWGDYYTSGKNEIKTLVK